MINTQSCSHAGTALAALKKSTGFFRSSRILETIRAARPNDKRCEAGFRQLGVPRFGNGRPAVGSQVDTKSRVAFQAAQDYIPPVAANSATGFGRPMNPRRTGALITIAGAFFVPAHPVYGGCVQDTFGCAGFLDSRSTNLRTAATLIRLVADGGSSSNQGATSMQQHLHALNPSSNSLAIAVIGAELIAYRINRLPEQRARLLGLVQMADTLGALNSTDRATLATSLNDGVTP